MILQVELHAAGCTSPRKRDVDLAYMAPRIALLLFLSVAIPIAAQECSYIAIDRAVDHLSEAIRFQTVSNATATPTDSSQFDDFAAWLPSSYPDIWKSLRVQQLGANQRSFLITWSGSNPALPAILLVTHYDVVPVTDATLKDWTHPPFSGAVADGYIWGRGAIDLKGSAIAQLEALTALLKQGYQPTRTIILSIGHDEEIGGAQGAVQMAAELERQGVEIDLVWDEGLFVFPEGVMRHLPTPLALVGTAEKVVVIAEVEFSGVGGHSSAPPTDGSGATTLLAKFLTALDRQQPPARLDPPTLDFVRQLTPLTPWWLGPLLKGATQWGPTRALLAQAMLAGGTSTAALVRSTVAPTVIRAGVAPNVLPQHVSLTLNARLLPGHTPEALVKYLQATCTAAGIPSSQVKISLLHKVPRPRVTVADPSSVYFQLLRRSIQEVWGPLPVLPALLPAVTDSRHYVHLSQHGVLRFQPVTASLSGNDLSRIHGTNERLSVQDFERSMCTYLKGIAALGSWAPGAKSDPDGEEGQADGPSDNASPGEQRMPVEL